MPFVPDSVQPIGRFVPDKAAASPAVSHADDNGTSIGDVIGGAIEPNLQLLSGAVAAPVAGIAGLGTAAGRALGMTKKEPGDVVHNVESALTYEPKTRGGKAASEVIGYPFKKLAQGADYAGGKVTDVLSKVPALRGGPAAAAGAGVNTALQSIPMLFGGEAAKGLEKAPTFLGRPPKPLTDQMTQAVTKAKASGYVLPPTEVRPNLLNRAIEGWGGKTNVEQALSIKNQPKTNAFARKAIGLKPDAPINPTTLGEVREQAGQSYAAVKNSKTPIEFDKEFIDSIDSMAGDYRAAQSRFPGLFRNDLVTTLREAILSPESAEKPVAPGREAPPIMRTLERAAQEQPGPRIGRTLEQAASETPGAHAFGEAEGASRAMPVPVQKMPSMTTTQAIETVKKLRHNATQRLSGRSFENPDNRALGFAERRAADAMDGLIERRLEAAGEKSLAAQYRKARTRIAQSYDVEAAHNEFTGNVDARKLAMMAGRRPLSAELRDIAEFGGAFKQAARPPETFGGHPGINPLDVGLALTEMASSGNPKWLGSLFARPLAAKVASSDVFQRRFVNPPGGAGHSMSPALLRLLLVAQQANQNVPRGP